MQKLTRQARIFLTAAVLTAAASISLYLMRLPDLYFTAALFLSAALITGLLYAKRRRTIASARLIVENQIFSIQPALTQNLFDGNKGESVLSDSMELIVSCFGVLLDSEVIKYNQEGIRLKEVELGHDFITLTYGAANSERRTRLLHAVMGEDELAEIARRFHYETGIMPQTERGQVFT